MNLEPIRALLELAEELQDGLDMMPDSGLTISSDEAFTIAASAPALSQLLEAVEGIEKLRKEYKYCGMNPVIALSVADDLKRLLHPEDK